MTYCHALLKVLINLYLHTKFHSFILSTDGRVNGYQDRLRNLPKKDIPCYVIYYREWI